MKSSRLVWLLVVVVLLGVGGGLGYWWYFHASKPDVEDMEAVLRLNNEGVGYLEQLQPPQREKAVSAFEEVVKLAPDWLPGRINLGIALFNRDQEKETLDRAIGIFQEVLKRDPDNPRANYCLGIIAAYQARFEEARPYFEKVTQKDPSDACAWYYLAKMVEPADSQRALECLDKALACDPHHHSALYSKAMLLRGQERMSLLERWKKYNEPGIQWHLLVDSRWSYALVGKYAQVIAPTRVEKHHDPVRLPLFLPDQKRSPFALPAGVTPAQLDDLGTDAVGEVRKDVRWRFGGTTVTLDYNRDGKRDLFVIGAVVDKSVVRNVLWRNEGESTFVDVTAEAGLAEPHPTLGCTVGDFDNDGYPDLFLTGVGSQKLYRNSGKGTFEDVTQKATLDQLTTVCLGSAFVDLDQDGDLDLLIAEYARTAEDARKLLKGEKGGVKSSGLLVYLNTGEAPPQVNRKENQLPLHCSWKRLELTPFHGDGSPLVAVALSDIDGDRDLEVITVDDRGQVALLGNQRLLSFQRYSLTGEEPLAGPGNGILVTDVDHDGQSDLFFVLAGKAPRLLLNRCVVTEKDVAQWFKASPLRCPPLKQAQVVDIDLDGWADVIGVTEQGAPLLLRNEEGRLVAYPDGLGPARDWPEDLQSVLAFDSGKKREEKDSPPCGGVPDLLGWSAPGGLVLRHNQGNVNHGIQVELVGQIKVHDSGSPSRCNADGLGTWVVAQAADLWTGQEQTTLSAGLGQSQQPLLLGLGQQQRLDVLRLRWPDGVLQSELDLACGQAPPLTQTERKSTSCPILFTYNGERFVFLTDFLGAGTIAERNPDGSCRPPRPEESVKIEAEQLQPREGFYTLSVAEPMDEITYLDQLQLVVLDHPEGTRVYPDERFATVDPQPTQEIFAFSEQIFPRSARDHRDREVLATLRHRDGKTVEDFARRAWLGFAEEHAIEMDFGDQLAAYTRDDRLFLCLAGWTDYAYPRALLAAEQAGVPMLPPVLERQEGEGNWHQIAEMGFPAGLPRLMTFEVTGQLLGPACKLRIRTNLQVYWDQIFVAARCQTVSVPNPRGRGVRASVLEVAKADLKACGMMQEYAPRGKRPAIFAHDRYEVVPVNRLAGPMTRYGEVSELLRQRDDCFVIFGPGDEVLVRFDARKLPTLPAGWKRSFVLTSWGYCKGTGPFTATGPTVEPLPFARMSTYPYGPNERYPEDARHRDYRRRYNTRLSQPDPFPRRR